MGGQRVDGWTDIKKLIVALRKFANSHKKIILPGLYLFPPAALRPNTGHGILIFEFFHITHNDAPQSVGLLWTSDQLVAETST
jgi:hypothetical protein